MTKYVKKRIPVDAVQSNKVTPAELRKFANNLIYIENPEDDFDPGYYAVFDYLHNTWVEFKPGDWIVKGVKGEFYPVEEAVFAETYEEYKAEGGPVPPYGTASLPTGGALQIPFEL